MMALLLESALRSLALGIVVWVGVRILRPRAPRVRMMIWVMVLAASLSMPLLASLPPVTIPAQMIPASFVTDNPPAEPAAVSAPMQSAEVPAVARKLPIDWLALATRAYLAVTGLLLVRLLIGLGMTCRLLYSARPITESWAHAVRVRAGEDITAPVTFGSTILLPADAGDWPESKRRAVLLHESAHVANGDFYIQLSASVNRAIFWFNPLTWWLRDHLIALAETISDDAVIAAMNDRPAYAEILLDIGGAGRTPPIGVAMARPRALSGRIDRILSETTLPKGLTPRGRTLVALSVLPAIFAASCVSPRNGPPSSTPVSIDYRGGTIDGRTLPRAIAVTVENWVAGALDSQDLPESWPQRIVLKTGKKYWYMTPWSQEGADEALWLGSRIAADHLVFRQEEKFHYIDDPGTVNRAVALNAIPPRSAERAARDAELEPLSGQLNSLHKDIADLRARIAEAASPEARSALIQRKVDLVGQQAMAEDGLSTIQAGWRAADKTKPIPEPTIADQARRYEQFRSLIDEARRQGLAKTTDTLTTASTWPKSPLPYQGHDAAIAVSGTMLTSAIAANESELVLAWRLRDRVQGDYVWFRRHFRSYYVTDPATVSQVLESMQEYRDINRQILRHREQAMTELFQKLADRRQERIALADEENRVHAEMAASSSAAERDRLAQREVEILERQDALEQAVRPESDPTPPPRNKPSVHALLQTAYDSGLATKIDP